MQNHAGSAPRQCLQNLADRGYQFHIIRNNGVHRTDIAYLTNNEEHLDIFLKKPLMPVEDLVPGGATNSQKSATQKKEDLWIGPL